jgi:hypothetical protein
MTRNTNDYTLGYARARRDRGCLYTLGFYDSDPRDFVRHEVRVDVLRPGLRALHASSYAFRPAESKTESRIRAAFVAPGLFQSGVVRAHLFTLQPASPKTWACMIAVEFPVSLADGRGAPVERDFGAILRDDSQVTHTFNRRVSLRARGRGGPTTRRVSFVEPVELRPGSYTLTAVMSEPGSDVPYTAEARIDVPPVPIGELFVTGPVLGRRAGDDVVVFSGASAGPKGTKERKAPEVFSSDRVGSAASFQPLLVHRVEGTDPLVAITQACLVKAGRARGAKALERVLLGGDGTPVGGLPALDLRLEGDGPVRCQTVVDVLPVSDLEPGPYLFRSTIDVVDGKEPGPSAAEVRFAVAEAGAGQD